MKKEYIQYIPYVIIVVLALYIAFMTYRRDLPPPIPKKDTESSNRKIDSLYFKSDSITKQGEKSYIDYRYKINQSEKQAQYEIKHYNNVSFDSILLSITNRLKQKDTVSRTF